MVRESPKEPMTPTRYPELDLPNRWKTEFEALRSEGYNQTEALTKLSEDYGGVSRTTLRRYLIPSDIANEKARTRRYWRTVAKPRQGQRRAERRQYNRLRRHISLYVRRAYRAASKDALNLRELSDIIKESEKVSLGPATLQGLLENYEEKHGYGLLKEVVGSDPVVYKLRS